MNVQDWSWEKREILNITDYHDDSGNNPRLQSGETHAEGPYGAWNPSLWWKVLASCPVLQVPSAASQLQDRPSPSQVLLLMVWSSHKRRARVAPSAARSPSHGLALDCGQPDANNVCFLQITLQRSVSAAKPHKYAKILKRTHITFIPCFFLAETSHFFFSLFFPFINPWRFARELRVRVNLKNSAKTDNIYIFVEVLNSQTHNWTDYSTSCSFSHLRHFIKKTEELLLYYYYYYFLQ